MVIRDEDPPGVVALLDVEPVDTVDTGRGVVGTGGGLLDGVTPTGPRVNDVPPAAGCWLHLTTRVFSLSTFTCARWEISQHAQVGHGNAQLA
jgi:hypothetical protein